jgi:glutamate transport system substrate-binding protein
VRLTRKLAPVAFLVTAMLSVSACADDPRNDDVPTDYVIEQASRSEMPDEIKAIFDSGKLTIGAKFDQPLTGMRDEATGRIEGFDAEIGRILAQRIFGNVAEGDNLFFIETNSGNREDQLRNDTVDLVVATYTMTDERKEEVDFAGPYYMAGQSILTRKGSDLKKVSDLSGKKVCTASGSTSLDSIEDQNPKADVSEPLRDYSSCLKSMMDGKYDAVSTDNTILYGYANENPSQLRVSKETFTEEPYGVGMPHDSPEMRKFINDTLEMAFENGDWLNAFDRTLGAAAVPEPEELPTIDRY